MTKLRIRSKKTAQKKKLVARRSNQLDFFFCEKDFCSRLNYSAVAGATESAGAAAESAGATVSTVATSSTTASSTATVSAASAFLSEEPQEKRDALKTTASNKTNFFIFFLIKL